MPVCLHLLILGGTFVAATWDSFHHNRRMLMHMSCRHDQGGCHQRELTIPGANIVLGFVTARLRRVIEMIALRALCTSDRFETLANASSYTAQGEGRFFVSQKHHLVVIGVTALLLDSLIKWIGLLAVPWKGKA